MPDLTGDQLRLLSAKPIGNLLPSGALPEGLFESANSTASGVYYTDYSINFGDSSASMSVDVLLPGDFEFKLPGVDAVGFGVGEEEYAAFLLRVAWSDVGLRVDIEGVELQIRFSRDLFLPAEALANDQYQIKPGTTRAATTTRGNLRMDQDYEISLDGFDEFTLEPVKLPSLNSVFLVIEGLKLDLSTQTSIPEVQAAGFDPSFQGLFARKITLAFQDDLGFIPRITAENFVIGTGGISGKIAATFDLVYDAATNSLKGDAAGPLFGDDEIQIGLRKFELELRANEVVSSDITGQMILPFFDKPVEVELSFDLKGNFSIGLKGAGGGVLAELTKEDLISMKVTSFGFSKRGQEIAFALGGSIKPLIGEDMNWPEFGVDSLVVKRNPAGKWDVVVQGGWIDFAEPLQFEFGAFKGELRKVGFGTASEDGSQRFIGFSGAVGFVSQFALAAEFEDLRLIYPNPIDVTLQRARIGLVIPETIAFIGEVSKQGGGFGGSLDLTVIPISLRVMGGAEFGSADDVQGNYKYMQILLGLELAPPGIVLGSTPLSIVGGEAKFALNMVPSMPPGWEWAVTPPKGIMPLSKLRPGRDGKMFAAGLKITSTDGTLLAANVLLALLLPGPVIFIEGRGAVLTKVFGEGDPGDPPFYTLMVIDGKEKYVSVNLAMNANLAKGVVKVTGTIGAFFDFDDVDDWYIRLGQKTPRSKRIEALAFKVLRGTSYFEASSGPHLLFGGDFGVNEKVNFKVGHANIEIGIGGEVDLSWKPQHAAGMMEFFAHIAIKVCGFGASMNASGALEAKTPYPRRLHVAAEYRYSFNLPWPLPDANGHGEIEKTWKDGSRITSFPHLVSEVRVDAEMAGLPAVDLQRFGAATDHPEDLEDVPLVSLDARPTIRFKYPVNDDSDLALAGNASNGPILHRVGDDEYRFAVSTIRLESRPVPVDPDNFFDSGDGWTDVEIPYGVWLADNSVTGYPAATVLRLFASTPFTHFRQSGFQGLLYTSARLDMPSFDASWLGTGAENPVFGEAQFGELLESPAAPSAGLAATVEERTPKYPVGLPEADWNYLGFSSVPMVFGLTRVEPGAIVAVNAVADASGVIRPFDVIDLHFLPPDLMMPELRTVPTLVRGVYFEEAIEVQFKVPVSDCVLYFYPVKSRQSSGSLPDDLGGTKSYAKPLDKRFADSILDLLEKLAAAVPDGAARDVARELVREIEQCTVRRARSLGWPAHQEIERRAYELFERQGRQHGRDLQDWLQSERELWGNMCCRRLNQLWEALNAAMKRGNAQTKHLMGDLEKRLSQWCAPVWSERPSDGVFLRFGLPALASDTKRPLIVEGVRDDAPVDTEQQRHSESNLVRIHVEKDGPAFDTVRLGQPGAAAGAGWFLVAIGYCVDVEESHEASENKIEDVLIGTGWINETGSDDDAEAEPPQVTLSARTCYRLTIETSVDSSNTEANYYYFRTDGPPASYLKEYVAWAVPGAGGYPLFQDYDISIRFGTNTVDQLFKGLPLEMRLRSSSGRLTTNVLGSRLAWEEETSHLLRPEEQAYIDVLNAAGMEIDPGGIPGDLSLTLAGARGDAARRLDPDQAYTASLALSPGSGFVAALTELKSVYPYLVQQTPYLLTPTSAGALLLGYPVTGLSEDIDPPVPAKKVDPQLFEFRFRSSRFTTFSHLFEHWTGTSAVQPGFLQIYDMAALKTALGTLADVFQAGWLPAQAALREKELQVQRRLASEESVLALLDRKAELNAQLEQAFNAVLDQLDGAPDALAPPAVDVEIYRTGQCIVVRLPESVEFARVSVAHLGFDVVSVCSADERAWLVFPADLGIDAFPSPTTLSITYRLNIGPSFPRLGYMNDEVVQVTL